MVRTKKAGLGSISLAVCVAASALPAAAQDNVEAPSGPRPTVSRTPPPSPNATINLINLLVKQGVITEEQAAALIKQADDEAYVARQAVREAATKAEGAEKTASAAADAVSPPGTKRVTYVPEIVKKQIREDIKKEVIEKAKKEGWVAPGTLPEWASRIRISGDVRVRYEAAFFPPGNYPYSVNYNAINTGQPYDLNFNSNPYFWPTYNTSEDRNRLRLRARLGLEADLYQGFWAGLRVATGDSHAPVSFNQTLGGSGGNFSKYAIWLDRAFLKYTPFPDLTFSVGRFDNPFFTPTDLVYHRDLGFDGFAAQAKVEVAPGITPFAVGGVFPVFNTDLNAGSNLDPSTGVAKFPSNDKWMYGAQLGAHLRPVPDVEATVGAAYYDFNNVQGRLSDPCFASTTSDACNTDLTRPSFAQKGNTYMALRDIVARDISNINEPRYQYFGLASGFRNIVVNGRLDFGHFHPAHVVLDGEYVVNTAFHKSDVAARALLNPLPAGPVDGSTNANYVGGNQGWLGRVTVGHRELKELWDWNFHVGYKYLESDAVIDAFTDSDFGFGGTNLKGYFVGANLGLGPNVWATARWMSANQVAGAPYAVDILQVDINGRF
ncbi:MAG TPA: putative porin [Xanthobacteraceae bacterium]|nr:putative porin [Xanthobacteraceae bacterium]